VNTVSTTHQLQPQPTLMEATPVLSSVPQPSQILQKPVQPQVILTKPRPAVAQFLPQLPVESDSKV